MTIRMGGKVYQGRTTNVSRGGLAADLPTALANGSEIECELQLVFDGDAQSEPLGMPARIVWCTAVEDVYQVGIAFKPMAAEKAQFLTMFLRYLDDSGPKTTQPKLARSVDDQFR